MLLKASTYHVYLNDRRTRVATVTCMSSGRWSVSMARGFAEATGMFSLSHPCETKQEALDWCKRHVDIWYPDGVNMVNNRPAPQHPIDDDF